MSSSDELNLAQDRLTSSFFSHFCLTAKIDIGTIDSRDNENTCITGPINVLNQEFVHFMRTVI